MRKHVLNFSFTLRFCTMVMDIIEGTFSHEVLHTKLTFFFYTRILKSSIHTGIDSNIDINTCLALITPLGFRYRYRPMAQETGILKTPLWYRENTNNALENYACPNSILWIVRWIFFEIISSVVMHVFSQNLEDLTLFFDVFSQVTIIIKLFSVIESSY